MKLTFLGTGGGRFCMIKQVRQTGGFVVQHDGFSMAVGPAPGALIYALRNDINVEALDAIFVSHAHLDHYGDADVLIEAMTNGCTEERGALVANRTTLEGDDRHDPAVGRYHRDAVERVVEAEKGQQAEFGDTKMTFTATRHKDIQTSGFRLDTGNHVIGYVPDSEMFEGLEEQYSGCDVLVVNAPRPHDRSWEGHMNLEEALELAREIGPDRAFVQHFGLNFAYNFSTEKQWLEENRGDLDITLASDNSTYDTEGSLERFL